MIKRQDGKGKTTLIFAIKEICIFMLIAQAVLFFVPGGTYVKYVRILIGILMILWITEPLLDFFADEKTGKEIQERMAGMFAEAGENSQMLIIEDGTMGVYRGIEQELKKKLVQCRNDYAVRTVDFDEEEGMVVITVESQREEETAETGGEIRIAPVVLGDEKTQEEEASDDNLKYGELQELKEQYGNCIGVDPERIIIRRAGRKGRG